MDTFVLRAIAVDMSVQRLMEWYRVGIMRPGTTEKLDSATELQILRSETPEQFSPVTAYSRLIGEAALAASIRTLLQTRLYEWGRAR